MANPTLKITFRMTDGNIWWDTTSNFTSVANALEKLSTDMLTTRFYAIHLDGKVMMLFKENIASIDIEEYDPGPQTTPADPERGASDAPRRFYLQRDNDVTGASGTGRVADGVRWPDGTVTVRWRGPRPSTVHWDRLSDAVAVHGHGGATQLVWLDPDRRAAGG